MPAGGGTAPDGCVDHSGDDTLMERVDYVSFEHLFRITLRDTRDGTSILLTASVPNLISMAHSLFYPMPVDVGRDDREKSRPRASRAPRRLI